MNQLVLREGQQLLYYHLVSYRKLTSIVDWFMKPSTGCLRDERLEAIASAYEVVKDNCQAAEESYKDAVDDSAVFREIMSSMTKADLSELGQMAYQHIMGLTVPMIALLDERIGSRQLSLEESHIKRLLTEVLSRLERTLPG